RAAANSVGRNHQAVHGISMAFPAMALKVGSRTQAKTRARTKEIRLYSRDSMRNCPIKLDLWAPMVFLRPTSLARLADLAVDRLMKLMMAKSRTKTTMAEKSQTNLMSPCFRPSCIFISDLRWISATGCKLYWMVFRVSI